MKLTWIVYIWDPKSIIKSEITDDYQNWIFDKRICIRFMDEASSVGELLNDYINYRKQYERMFFVYDGNKWLDSAANDAIYTMSYQEYIPEINHHTRQLIDNFTKTNYVTGNGKKLLAEILYNFYDKFFTNELNRAQIDGLKNHF